MEFIDDLTFVRPEEPLWPTVCYAIGSGIVALFICIKIGMYVLRRYHAYRAYTRPRREAIAALELAYAQWREQGYTTFMFQVVNVLKRYLTDNFKSSASMLTYEELEQAIHDIRQLSAEEQNLVIAMLKECDLACYALAPVQEADIERLYTTSTNFVLHTWRNTEDE